MAQQWRPTYPRAIYHVMNRGDRREATFTDDAPLVVSKQALMAGGHHEGLFEGADAFAHFFHGGGAQRAHALIDGDFGNLHGAAARNDHLADFIGDAHGFEDGGASGIAAVIATIAAAPAENTLLLEKIRGDVEIAEHGRRISHRLLAGRTNAAHEPLRAGKDDGGGDEEGGDTHVVHAGDGAGGVITMHRAEHLVAGEGGFDGDFGGLRVADFADHNDVGILAQDGAEGIAKGKADFLLHGHLIDAGHLKFHRVFDGDNVVFRVVQFVEGGVKRGGFARTGRPGDEDQAVRRINRRAEAAEGIDVHANLLHGRGEVGFVQDAEHAFFAVDGGQERNAQVEIPAGDFHPHAAVLREAAFGNVERAHDLEAGDEGDLQALRRRRFVDQHAIDAVAQAHHFFERLHMDVTGALLDRLDEDQIGQFDDGAFFDRKGQFVEVDLLDGFLDGFQGVGAPVVFGLFGGVLDDVLHRAGLAGVEVVQLVDDGFFGRDQRRDFHLGDAPHVIDGEHIQGIGHRQEQLVLQP